MGSNNITASKFIQCFIFHHTLKTMTNLSSRHDNCMTQALLFHRPDEVGKGKYLIHAERSELSLLEMLNGFLMCSRNFALTCPSEGLLAKRVRAYASDKVMHWGLLDGFQFCRWAVDFPVRHKSYSFHSAYSARTTPWYIFSDWRSPTANQSTLSLNMFEPAG